MQKENDELIQLFQSRLTDAELSVRDGFWEELETSVAVASRHRRRLVFFRVAAVASVLLVLVTTFAAIWCFSPKEEVEHAFRQVALTNGGHLDGDGVQIHPLPITVEPILKKGPSSPVGILSQGLAPEDSVTVTVSMSFVVASSSTFADNRPHKTTNYQDKTLFPAQEETEQSLVTETQQESRKMVKSGKKKPKWNVKVQAGVGLPAEDGTYKMPLTAGFGLERKLNDRIGLETGLMYSNLRSPGQTLHYIGIPVKVNLTLAESKKLEWYLTAGGQADKCIAGAPDHSFSAEPIQLSLMAGVGLDYKITDRIAVFAEPSITHHFNTDSKLATIRTERSTNFNLLCGVRMTY